MKTRLTLIALAAAAFGWGFSVLAKHPDQTIRPDNPGFACQEWQSEGCTGPVGADRRFASNGLNQ